MFEIRGASLWLPLTFPEPLYSQGEVGPDVCHLTISWLAVMNISKEQFTTNKKERNLRKGHNNTVKS